MNRRLEVLMILADDRNDKQHQFEHLLKLIKDYVILTGILKMIEEGNLDVLEH